MVRYNQRAKPAEDLAREVTGALGHDPISLLRIESYPVRIRNGIEIMIEPPFETQGNVRGTVRNAMKMVEEAIRVTNEEFKSGPKVKLARVEFQVGRDYDSMNVRACFGKDDNKFDRGTKDSLHYALSGMGATEISESVNYQLRAFELYFSMSTTGKKLHPPQISTEAVREAVQRKDA